MRFETREEVGVEVAGVEVVVVMAEAASPL